MDNKKIIQNFLAIRERLQRDVYQAIILERDQLMAENPSMKKVERRINDRLELLEKYDEAAVKTIALFFPEIMDEITKEVTEITMTTDDLKKHYAE